MSFIKPDRIPATGHTLIDEGHRALAEDINAIYTQWQNEGESPDLRERLHRFIQRVGRHFTQEEAILGEAEYEGLTAHARRHREIKQTLDSLYERLERGEADMAVDTFQAMDDLLYEHEILEDQDFRGLFQDGQNDLPTLVEWRSALETGIPEVDTQHKELATLLNRLYEAVISGASEDELIGLLETLAHHTRRHFDFEEAYMDEHGTPGIEGHKRAHRNLLADMGAVIEDAKAGRLRDLDGLVENYLKFWLLDHILRMDMRLVSPPPSSSSSSTSS